MADTPGPISTLPGSAHAMPSGAKCDEHPDRDAVARIQGETDSFGSEMNDLCDECVKALKAMGHTIGKCDWCKAPDVELHNRRDTDEGTRGPVYSVCRPCASAQQKRLEDELDQYERED